MIPCQVVGMRRTGERAAGQYQGIYPERALPAGVGLREGKGLFVGKHRKAEEDHRGFVEGSCQCSGRRDKVEKRDNIKC